MKSKKKTKPTWHNPHAMYTLALSYLAKREHASQELAEKLSRKTHQKPYSPEICALIKQLQENNLLNDARFAENYSQLRARQGYGKWRIQAELKQRGILLEKINININTNIHEIREKKFGRILPTTPSEKAKQARYLSYKGFATDEIQVALKYTQDNDGEYDHDNDQ